MWKLDPMYSMCVVAGGLYALGELTLETGKTTFEESELQDKTTDVVLDLWRKVNEDNDFARIIYNTSMEQGLEEAINEAHYTTIDQATKNIDFLVILAKVGALIPVEQ